MSRDFKADLAILTSGQWGRHEEDWFKNNGVEIAVSAIERADKYEALAREQENQIDILSTTLAMYCSPYYDMQERAEKAEALARELKKSLKFFFDCISNGDLVEPEPSQWMSLELSPIAALYHKAREVLRDE